MTVHLYYQLLPEDMFIYRTETGQLAKHMLRTSLGLSVLVSFFIVIHWEAGGLPCCGKGVQRTTALLEFASGYF